MKDGLSANTEIVSYFLWELTRHGNALDLWYCAEDMGYLFDEMGLYEISQINELLNLPKTAVDYIEFVRHIAYRLFVFTSDNDTVKNWFISEKLLKNNEWINALLAVSKAYAKIRGGNAESLSSIRSEKLRKLYG